MERLEDILGLIAWLTWRPFIKVHSTAQAALNDTFAKTDTPHPLNAPDRGQPRRSHATR